MPKMLIGFRCLVALAWLCSLLTFRAEAAWVWIEGEHPAVNRMNRHPWYDQVKRDLHRSLFGGCVRAGLGCVLIAVGGRLRRGQGEAPR